MLGALAAQNIGFVDSERILADYEDAKIARSLLDQSVYQWRHELDSLRRLHQEAEVEFKAQQPMLSEDALRARQQELDAMRKQYETFAQDIWGEGGKAELKHKELFAPVVDKINATIEEIAVQEGLTMVFDISEGGILYADVVMDLTSQVLEVLNAEYVAVQGTDKRKMAVLSVAALDEKSQAEGFDVKVRAVVEQVVASFEKDLDLESIPQAEVNQMIELYGELPTRPIDDVPAIEIGRNLDADFVYTGTVASEGGDVIVSVKLIKPPSREVLPEATTRITENEMPRLDQKVTELVTQLQAYLVAETE